MTFTPNTKKMGFLFKIFKMSKVFFRYNYKVEEGLGKIKQQAIIL